MNEEKVHTHYDNLKVTRNAPVEVIKAAYRAMAQKYHPDVNKSPGAERVMKIVNEAWEVLSDPVERQKHDRWIEDEERRIAMARPKPQESSPEARETTQSPRKEPPSSEPPTPYETPEGSGKGTRNILLASLALFVALYFFSKSGSNNSTNTGPSISPVSASSPAPLPFTQPSSAETDVPIGRKPRLADSEPSAAPESSTDRRLRLARLGLGQQLPETSAYIVGSPRLADAGHSKLIIDNTSSQSDVVVKVCRAGSEACFALRHAFVRVGETFTFEDMTAGTYDIRYVSLESGGISKSEVFDLEEISQDGGTRFSVLTITLYTVEGGNTRMEHIDDSQF